MSIGNNAKKEKLVWILILHALVCFLSFGGVLSKCASQQEFLSLPFIGIYIAEIFILFVYALLWQQVLKHLSLTFAFANKAVSMIWATTWGVLFFDEVVTWQMLLGIGIVLVGVLIVVTADE